MLYREGSGFIDILYDVFGIALGTLKYYEDFRICEVIYTRIKTPAHGEVERRGFAVVAFTLCVLSHQNSGYKHHSDGFVAISALAGDSRPLETGRWVVGGDGCGGRSTWHWGWLRRQTHR